MANVFDRRASGDFFPASLQISGEIRQKHRWLYRLFGLVQKDGKTFVRSSSLFR